MRFKFITIKTFINGCRHKVKLYKDKVISIHTFLNTTTESSMYKNWKTTDRNLYFMFFGWLLENLWYGLLISISLTIFGVSWKWYMPFTLATLYWLSIDTIKRITLVMRK